MIYTLHHVNFFLHHAALNLIRISALAITLCVMFPLFLLIVIVGTGSAGACALGNRWNERRVNIGRLEYWKFGIVGYGRLKPNIPSFQYSIAKEAEGGEHYEVARKTNR